MSQTSRESRSGSKSSSSIAVRRTIIRRGRCNCGDLVVYLTSHTDINPNRNFWRCRHFLRPNDCGFFLWDDESGLDGAERQNVIEGVKTFEELEDMKRRLAERQMELEATKRKWEDTLTKLEDMKTKLEDSQLKIVNLQWNLK
ncbi:uncharacterized protein At4g04775-like [Lotus japonicus]|uniref:uncharacterized protein At4g04775-like n=1 Tax=Lotus japonicus TaxID=34305 RepID=UPI00258C24AF|nr:uncharacterized protein At4g04775-like [Lotus japonicus]